MLLHLDHEVGHPADCNDDHGDEKQEAEDSDQEKCLGARYVVLGSPLFECGRFSSLVSIDDWHSVLFGLYRCEVAHSSSRS